MPFKCEKCNKEFKRKKYLMNHINKNICDKYKNLPYSCEYCNKKYSLKEHYQLIYEKSIMSNFRKKKKDLKINLHVNYVKKYSVIKVI